LKEADKGIYQQDGHRNCSETTSKEQTQLPATKINFSTKKAMKSTLFIEPTVALEKGS
jgi:hypothetical protein